MIPTNGTVMVREFNFRHVAHRCGIPSNNRNNWELGQVLRAFFAGRGIEPTRPLTEKTDPSPTVDAPHCIAHYPVGNTGENFIAACRYATDWWGERSKQKDLFE
jgi:hypothetical protein